MPPDRLRRAPSETDRVRLRVDGVEMQVAAGRTVAAALLENGLYRLRNSPGLGAPRSAFCMMGACQECAIEIDGAIRRACQVEVREGMTVTRAGAGMGGDAAKISSPETARGPGA